MTNKYISSFSPLSLFPFQTCHKPILTLYWWTAVDVTRVFAKHLESYFVFCQESLNTSLWWCMMHCSELITWWILDSAQIINHIHDCAFKGLSECRDFNTEVNMKVFKLISLLIRTLKLKEHYSIEWISQISHMSRTHCTSELKEQVIIVKTKNLGQLWIF